jgi:hypothetical protein
MRDNRASGAGILREPAILAQVILVLLKKAGCG